MARLRRGLAHTRVVTSGSYPLYRLMALGAFISGLVQVIERRVPPSIRSAPTPGWYDYAFVGLQLLGALLILVGLYMETDKNPNPDRAHLSLTIELVGLWFLGTSIAAYTYGVLVQNHGLPITMVSWFGVAMLCYIVRRMREIRRGVRELRR